MIESPTIAPMKTVKEIRRDNARTLAKDGPAEFARVIESTTQQVNQFMGPNPTRNIGDAIARRIEAAYRKPTGWLDVEHISPKSGESGIDPEAALIKQLLPEDKGNVLVWERPEDLEPDENRVWIDRYDYHFSAGTGLIQWEIREKKALPFDVGFFKAIGSKPKDCKLLTVRGDSMEPFLFNRDMMMVDSTRVNVRDGQVYAIYFEDEPLVKQIFKQVGGGIVLHSYNGKYPDRLVPPESMELVKIVGEVIYRSGSAMAGGN